MFAYCGNAPVGKSDPSGHASWGTNTVVMKDGCGGGTAGFGSSGGATGGAVIPFALEDILDAAKEIVASVAYYTSYKAFARATMKEFSEMLFDNYPRIHHVVPYGDFSSRNPQTVEMLNQAHEIMIGAGVIPYSDNNNKIVVSNYYHVGLHTDAYIEMVTKPIIALGEGATKEQIYEELYYLRIIIAAGDPMAYGY